MSTAKSGTIVRLLERFQEQRSSPASRSRFHITTDPNLTSVLLVALIGLLVTTCLVLASPPVYGWSGLDFVNAMVSP